MNILFLGGTGNISTDCAALLHKRGNRITVVTRGRTPVPAEYEAIVADRHVPGQLKQALEGRYFDVVADFTTYNPDQAAIAYDALNGRCGQYIFVSTICVYAKPHAKLPVTEDAKQGNIYSEYGRLKEYAEAFFTEKYRNEAFPLTIVRPAHTYSHLWIPNPVTSAGYTLAYRLENHLPVFVHDDGQTPWTLTHTRDFAVGFAGLAGNSRALGEAFQITSSFVLTWKQILEEIIAAVGVDTADVRYFPTEDICRVEPIMEGKLKGDKANPGIFDCSKLKSIVPDFDCKINFHDGIRESIAWFREDAKRMVPDPIINARFDKIINALS